MLRTLKSKIIFFLLFANIFAMGQKNDSLQNALQSQTDKGKVNLLQQEAQIAYKKNNTSQAIEYYKQAAEVADKINDRSIIFSTNKNLGSIYYVIGNFQLAKDAYTKALKNTEEKSIEKADVLYAIGNISFANGSLPAAVKNYLDALQIYTLQKNSNGKLNTYLALAGIYERQNNFSSSIEYNLKALSIFENNKDKFRLLSSYENVGNIFLNKKKHAEAEKYFDKALKIYREIGNKAGEAITLQKIGKLNSEKNNFHQAKEFFKLSLTIANNANAKPLIVLNLNGIAKTQLNLGEYEEAEKNYLKAINISKEIGQRIELDEAYEGLRQLYNVTNKKNKSLAFHNLSTQIQDSMFNDSILKQMSNLQLIYESEQQKNRIALLNKDSELKNIELGREIQIRNFLIALSVLMLILFAVFYYYFNKNKQISKDLSLQYKLLEQQKQELTRLNNVKDRFFSIISHDLRNNLTTMKLYFDLVSNKNYVAKKNSDLTNEIAMSVQNNIDLLENLLVWASAQIKGIPLKVEHIKIHKLVDQNIKILNSSSNQKNISLLNLTDENELAYADLNMVNLVLRNLISNAIKFTKSGGEVSISTEIENNYLKVSVIDNGIGISKDKLKIMFTQHADSSSKGTANEKGTGLGLLLCKDFIEKNGGEIWAESEEEKGSCFNFTLPIK